MKKIVDDRLDGVIAVLVSALVVWALWRVGK